MNVPPFKVPALISASGLARKMDQCSMRLTRAIKSGTIVPDYVSGRSFLFRPERVAEITRILNEKPTK